MRLTNPFSSTRNEFLLIVFMYVGISVFFLSGLIVNPGDAAQGDWGTPLATNAAINDFSSRLFVRTYNGFGEISIGRWGFPFFQFFNALLAPFGFFGGAEIKILAVFLVALGGISAYFLARSFRLGRLSSFLSGLFFMTTPVMFNWLMFGWIYYLLAYDLFPLMLLTIKKFLETNHIRYALINGLILVAATSQPAFILIYPTVGVLFVLFECRNFFTAIRKGLTITAISVSVWFLTALSFFTSYNNVETLSIYHGDYFKVIQYQFRNFGNIMNPIRLWGSTFNFQFETYFLQELIIVSFIPVFLAAIVLLLRPREKRVLFFFISYLFALLAYLTYGNLEFLVFNFPFGAIFEAPSIFLVPASLGLAFLISYFNHIISTSPIKLRNILCKRSLKHVSFFLLLLLIVSVSIPWWTGQASGKPISGPATKLNLFSIPSGFTQWSNIVAGNEYFVLYIPLDTNLQILNSTYFSQAYEGINMGIFTEVNDLPYVSVLNSSIFLDELMSSPSMVAEKWGNYSIRYIVVYTDVESAYNMSDILDRLSLQSGFLKVATFDDVVVFEDKSAKPVVYADNADLQILYHDPTLFKVQANSVSPFTLIFNQVYSGGWRAWVNGTAQPNSTHFKDVNGFNGWHIDSTGNMTINLYYEPQTTYLISMIISAVTIITILLYLLFATIIKNYRRSQGK